MKFSERKSLKKEKGFTLVEIAIVLVIIGLLLAGILKGQAMIKQAKVKRLKADIDSIVASVYSYQDKYGYLPGDDPKNHVTDLGATSCTGGNGDGYFNTGLEYPCAWQELIGAGFMSGNPATHTESQVAKTSPFGTRYYLRYNGALSKNYIFVDNIPHDVAQSLDERYDDGIYNSGSIRANAAYTGSGVRDMYWFVL